MRLRFGDCVLDTDVHELTRAGRAVPLSPKAFLLLAALAERRPFVVTKGELRRLVWPDTVLGGTTLARLVNEVRAAVGDDARAPEVIRTIPRVGYAFGDGASAPAVASMRCALEWGRREVALAPGENVIGRTSDALITVVSPKVSRRHARIVVTPTAAMLEDLGSKNGTYLGDRRIDGPTALKEGDRIEIGPAVLIFHSTNTDEATLTGGR